MRAKAAFSVLEKNAVTCGWPAEKCLKFKTGSFPLAG